MRPLAAPFAFVALALGALGAERLVEVAIHRRHMRRLAPLRPRIERDDGFGLILASQALLFTMLPAEALLAPWPRLAWWSVAAVAGILLAQALRYWVIFTLGERWTVRVVTLPGRAPVAAGPYRFLRHPNYVAVMLEALAWPLLFSAWATLPTAALVTALALARRIRVEDRALAQAASERDAPGADPHG